MKKKKPYEIKDSAFEGNKFDPRWLMAFDSLSEFTEFMNEKINDGEEISKGKSPTDQSKEEKAEGEMEGGVEMEAPPAPIVDPHQAPGSQIALGKKKQKSSVNSKTQKIKVGQTKEKINVRPTVDTKTMQTGHKNF